MITSKTDLQALARQLKEEVVKLHSYADTTFRSAVTEVFEVIVKGTPQYSGNLATNWHISTEASGGSYAIVANAGKYPLDRPYQRGDDPAVTAALSAAKAVISAAKYGTDLYVYNPVPYMAQVEAGQGPHGLALRPENLVDGEVIMLRVGVLTAMHNGWK